VFLLLEMALVVLRCLYSRFKLVLCSSCWNYLPPVVDQARYIRTSFRRSMTVEKHNRVAYPTAPRERVSIDGKLHTYLPTRLMPLKWILEQQLQVGQNPGASSATMVTFNESVTCITITYDASRL
jgi:hypothetical protein